MSHRRRICFINRSYWPDAEATGQLLTELCEDLADRFDVTVIAGQPNHNPDQAAYATSGIERRHGVTIRRVRHTRWSKETLIGRGINFLTFLAGAAWAAFTVAKPDVVIVETDPPLLCLLGAWLRWWRGCRLVIYLQDIHPDIGVALGKMRQGWITDLLRRAFVRAYRRADSVVVLSEDMRSLVLDWGVPAKRAITIANWVDTKVVCPVKSNNRFRADQGLNGQFVVMYSGNMGLCQPLDEVLAAAEHLRSETHIRFVLVGHGASRQRLVRRATERRLDNVSFLNYQPKDQLSRSLSAADIHLVPLDPRITRFMMPSKVYAILSCGTPLIAVAPEDCELARLVQAERIGSVTLPGDPVALAEQIRRCAGNPDELTAMGRRARQLALDRFDRRATTDRFAELLGDVSGDGPAATTRVTTHRQAANVPRPSSPAVSRGTTAAAERR